MSDPTRRRFLAHSTSLAAAVSATSLLHAAAAPGDAPDASAGAKTLRAAVIGHTGRGDYGHGLLEIFNGRADCEVVALADPDDAGRAKAAATCGAAKQYADYRVMLAAERPDVVSIAPRQSDQHLAMALAAVEAGAHVFMEKPMASSCEECDQILAAADRAKRKVAVAHQMRFAPRMRALDKALKDGLLGELLQMDAWGKQDPNRAGGEDMMVLGTHLFDLLRHFGGEPQWCTARVLSKGRDITRADAHPAGEPMGPVAGDEVFAQFAFSKGVNATFGSRAKLRDVTGAFGIEIVGTKGSMRLLAGVEPQVLVRPAGAWTAAGRADRWEPLGGIAGKPGDFNTANRRLVDDWIDAIRTDREPLASGRNAAQAIEMVMAVYQAALAGSRVTFPLKDRKHPLL